MIGDRLRDLRGGFYQVENSFLKQHGKTVGVYGIAAYNVIAMHANSSGEDAFPSYKTISTLTGMSQRKAVDAVNQLVDVGVLLRESRFTDKGQTSNIYTLLPVPYAQDAPPPMHDMHPPYAQDAHDQYPINKTPVNKSVANASCESDSSPTHRSPAPPKSRKKRKTSKRSEAATQLSLKNKKLLEEYEPRGKPTWPAIEKQINSLAAGDNPMTPDEYEYVFREMKRDSFWKEKHLSPASVGKQAGPILAKIAGRVQGEAVVVEGW